MPEMKGISLIPAQYFAKKIDSNEINHYAGCGSKQIANRFYAVPLVISEAGALVAHIAYLAPAIILKVVTFPTKYCFSCCRSIDSNLKISATLKNTIKLVALIFCGIVFGAVISPRYNNILNKKLGLIDDPRFSLRRTAVEESNSDDDDAVGSDNHESGSDDEGGAAAGAAAGNLRQAVALDDASGSDNDDAGSDDEGGAAAGAAAGNLRQADASNDASGSDNDDAGSDDEGGAAASGENAKRMGGYSAAAGNRDNDDSGEVDLLADTRFKSPPSNKRARSASVATGSPQVHQYSDDLSEVGDEEPNDARLRRVSNAGGTMGPRDLELARTLAEEEEANGSASASAAAAAPVPRSQPSTPMVEKLLKQIDKGRRLESEIAVAAAALPQPRAASASSGSDSGVMVSPPNADATSPGAAGSSPEMVGTPPSQRRSLAAGISPLRTPLTPGSPFNVDDTSPIGLAPHVLRPTGISDSPLVSPLSPDRTQTAAVAAASPLKGVNLGSQLAAVAEEEPPLAPAVAAAQAPVAQGPAEDENPYTRY